MTVTAERPATWDAVEAAQRGEMDAFGRLWQTYHAGVYRFIYFRVDSKQTAEDLCSTVFLRAMTKIGSLQWRGKDLGAWLMIIARNLIADHYKRAEYRLAILTAELPEATHVDHCGQHGRVDWSPDHADTVVDGEIGHLLRAAVATLTDEQRQAIELRFFREMSLEEAAAVMGKNTGAVKALTHRAMCALRHLLDGAEVR